nr:PH108-65 [Vibrio phage 1]
MKNYFKICIGAILNPNGSITKIKADGEDRKRAEIYRRRATNYRDPCRNATATTGSTRRRALRVVG